MKRMSIAIFALSACQKKKNTVPSPALPAFAIISDSGRIDSFSGIYYYHFNSASDYHSYEIDTIVSIPCIMYVSYPTNDSVYFSTDNTWQSFTFHNSWGQTLSQSFRFLDPVIFPKVGSEKYMKNNSYFHLTPDSLSFEYGRSPSDIQFKGGDGYTYTDAIFRGKKM